MCKASGCTNEVHALGWCEYHYDRMREGRDQRPQIGPEDLVRRVLARTAPDGECLIWQGARTDAGSPRITVGRRNRAVHHLVYESVHGPIPKAIHVEQTCGNRLCIAVGHLRLKRKPRTRKRHQVEPASREPRACTRCGAVKPVEEFSPNAYRPSGVQTRCRQCNAAVNRISKGVHPDDADLVAPDGQCCEICDIDGGERGLFLDHDHETGRFRGWLCHGCNSAIGLLRDDPTIMERAIAYVGGAR